MDPRTPARKREGVKHGTFSDWKWKRRGQVEVVAADRRIFEPGRPHGTTLEPLCRTSGASSRSGKNAGGRFPLGDRRVAALEADAALRVEQGGRLSIRSHARGWP